MQLIRRVNHFLDDYFGQEARPGHAPIPGMAERQAVIEAVVADIQNKLNTGNEIDIGAKVNLIQHQADEGLAIGRSNARKIEQLAALLRRGYEERSEIMRAGAIDRQNFVEAIVSAHPELKDKLATPPEFTFEQRHDDSDPADTDG
jgi:hypothetical protein